MTIVASTFEMTPMGLTGVEAPLTWDNRASRIKASIVAGIEQARMNLGTFLTDDDLKLDDDE